MNHTMSPTGVAVLLLLALVVDYMSVGPNSIRDRLAFLLALTAIREGFNDSPLDRWTVEALAGTIDVAKNATGGAYIAGAVTNAVVGAVVGIVAIYTVGALMPDKLHVKLGGFAQIKLPAGAAHRINYKLWTLAAFLGMLSDLPGGTVGSILRSAIAIVTNITSLLPNALFGAS